MDSTIDLQKYIDAARESNSAAKAVELIVFDWRMALASIAIIPLPGG